MSWEATLFHWTGFITLVSIMVTLSVLGYWVSYIWIKELLDTEMRHHAAHAATFFLAAFNLGWIEPGQIWESEGNKYRICRIRDEE